VHELPYMDMAVVYVDPTKESSEEHHSIAAHSHDGLPTRTKSFRQ